jgi:methylated-DNA-protein-cysteine methyltransferase-like protein
MKDDTLKEKVYALVAQIPEGRVMTYGQVAALAGKPRGAWEVGQIAHFGPTDLPWQRVVNKQGGLAIGWPGGGREAHKALLEAEGVEVSDAYTIDVAKLQWWPDAE